MNLFFVAFFVLYDFAFSVASTDSESMISDLRGLPIQIKGVLNRRPFQQQYILPQGSIFFEFLILLKRFYESKWSAMFSPSVLEVVLRM